MISNIDFLIVGAGLYGATIGRLLTDAGFNCLIIERRNHIGGNIYSEKINGYDKHVYGAHIFHTDNYQVEAFAKQYSEWNNYRHNVIATDNKKLYHLPFNMNTYYDIFDVCSPAKAKSIIEEEVKKYGVDNPRNLEEQAINLVGKTIYNKLIKNYTEKQWGKKCNELSPDIIKRLPLRFSFDNNYFNDRFQAIPKNGYTVFVKNIIGDIPCICNTEFDYEYWKDKVKTIIYCGSIDELLNYELGELEWRSLKFKDTSYIYNGSNGQGTSVKNDVSKHKYTRYIEHMWFTPEKVYNGITSIITSEQPVKWKKGNEKYYPINNNYTETLYNAYLDLLHKKMPNVELGGRLGKYKYFDMDDTILEAMKDAEKLIEIHDIN